jgi:hypothetical protein
LPAMLTLITRNRKVVPPDAILPMPEPDQDVVEAPVERRRAA